MTPERMADHMERLIPGSRAHVESDGSVLVAEPRKKRRSYVSLAPYWSAGVRDVSRWYVLAVDEEDEQRERIVGVTTTAKGAAKLVRRARKLRLTKKDTVGEGSRHLASWDSKTVPHSKKLDASTTLLTYA